MAEAEREVTLAACKEAQSYDAKPPARDREDQSGRIQLPPPPKSARLASRQAVMEEREGKEEAGEGLEKKQRSCPQI